MGKNIYFVSDLNLGALALRDNREREQPFTEWLQSIREDTGMLFLMGDFFDFWFEYKKAVPKGFVRSLGALASFCDNGIPVHFFTGNHDIWAFDYLRDEVGMVLHTDAAIMELYGKKFFLHHGDDLGKKDFLYQIIKGFFHNKLAQWAFAKIHPDLSFRLAHFWSKKSRLSYAGKVEQQRSLESEEQYLFAKTVLQSEQIDYFVFGHRHIAVNEKIGESSRLIILGDWIKKFTYGVFDGNNFRLEAVAEDKLKKFQLNRK